MNNHSKDQIKKCIIDLAERCKELGDHATYASLLVVAASIAEGSELMLASWLAEYAKLRMNILDSELKEDIDNQEDKYTD